MEVLISQLEREAHQLEQDGDDIRAIRMMERALAQRITARMSGSIPAAERLVVKYNTVAVRCFKNDDFEAAQTLLNSALELTADGSVVFLESDTSRVKLRGTTLNNYGCLERRRGNLPAAAAYLKQSIEHAGQDSPASFLNLSAVLTNLGRYTDAVAWCRRAIAMLENQQHQNMISSSEASADGGGGGGGASDYQQQQQVQQVKSDAPGLMAIAYHNLASPLEQLDRAAAIAAYRKALEIARTEIGINSSTTRSIQMNLDRFLKMAPAQVTAAGSPAQQMHASQQLAAASGDLTAANNAGKYTRSSVPAPGSFLPPVGSSGGAAAGGARVHPQSSSSASTSAAMTTARERAAALAAARRKPDYVTSSSNRGYVSRSSQNSTPTGGIGGGGAARPSPRRLSPIGDRTRTPSRASTPPRFMTERRKAGKTHDDDDNFVAEKKRNEIRERTAVKIAAERESKRHKEPMAKSQERTRSRTPPPPSAAVRGKNLLLDEDDRARGEEQAGRANRREMSQSARGPSTKNKQAVAGKPPRPRSSESRDDDHNSTNISKPQRQQQQPVPPKTERSKNAPATARPRVSSAATTVESDSTINKKDRKSTGKPASDSAGGAAGATSTRNTGERVFSRAPVAGSGSGNPVKDLEEEISKKDDIVSFMVARLAALLRAEEDFERCYIAVCRIQCLFRKVRAKTRVDELRRQRQLAATYRQVRENSAARCLVRFFRRLVAHRQEAVLLELREEEISALNNMAAAKIQRMARMWLARRELIRRRADARLHAKALRVLQCWFRKLLAQSLADRLRRAKRTAESQKILLERREFAASQIQRIFLGRRDALKIHRIRRSMRMLREKEMESRRTSSAKRIQAAWRGCLGRQVARKQRCAADALRAKVERWELVQRATMLLQAWTRGTLTRLRSAPELVVFRQNQVQYRCAFKNDAATKINAVVRGFISRRRVRRALAQRTTDRRREWFVFLVPRLQSFVRARFSVRKTAKRLRALHEQEAREQIELFKQRVEFDEAYGFSFAKIVSLPEIEQRKEIAKSARESWMRAHASDLRFAEQLEALMKQRAAEAELKRQQDVELATSAPLNGERRRPGVVSNELKVGYEKTILDELDEEDEDARRIFAVQDRIREEQLASAREERLRNAPARAPFYDKSEVESRVSANTASASRQQQQHHGYEENPQRGLSVPVRETLRKHELSRRAQDRLTAIQVEEGERQRLLADASGIKLSAANAVARANAVIAEAMPEVEKTHACENLPSPHDQQHQEQQDQKQDGRLTCGNSYHGNESKKTLSKQSVQLPEVRRNEWDDFSCLDRYTTAHRDEVLNAFVRKSVSLVQALLRCRSCSFHVASLAASKQKKNATAAAASASAKQAVVCTRDEPRKQIEIAAVLQREKDRKNANDDNAAVTIVQSFARTVVSCATATMKTCEKLQEQLYAAGRIQTAVREKQSKPQRIANLRRENLRRRTVGEDGDDESSSSITEKTQEDQVRDYAARHIQTFLRARFAKRKVDSTIITQKRNEKLARSVESERSCTSLTRAFAIKIIQLFFRKTLRRLRARRKRQLELKRCAQVRFGEALEQERDVAIRLMQGAARLFLRRLRRRQRIATTARRLYEIANQLDDENHYAAVKIQSAVRGWLARRRRRELETQKARKWAGLLDQELDGVDNDKEHRQQQQEDEAAVKIQCAFRTGAAKKQASQLREQKKAEWERMAQEAARDEQ